MITSLDAAISTATLAWVDAEFVGELVTGDSRNSELLGQLGVSVTDLKLLLRAVLRPRGAAQASMTSSGVGSLRDSDWLISSLVFWRVYYETGSDDVPNLLAELTDRLRNLQAQRDAPVGRQKPGAAVERDQGGISALEKGRIDEADKRFREALRIGQRADVERLFVNEYATRWQASRQARITEDCAEPLEADLDHGPRIEVETLLNQPASRLDRRVARNFSLCLRSSMPLRSQTRQRHYVRKSPRNSPRTSGRQIKRGGSENRCSTTTTPSAIPRR